MNLTEVNNQFIPRKGPGLIERVNPAPHSTISIMNLDNEESLFILDGLSSEVWKKIDGKKNLEKIKQEMLKEKKLPDRFSKDVDQLICDLKKEKLIE